MKTLERQSRTRPPAVREDPEPPAPRLLQIRHLRRIGAPPARAAVLAELVFTGGGAR